MKKYIPLKTSWEVDKIRKSCQLAEEILKDLICRVAPGVTPHNLDRLAAEMVEKSGARRAIPGDFPGTICVSVNEIAVHGIPSSLPLKEGDLLTIDLSLSLDGWCGDGAWCCLVGSGNDDTRRLLKATWRASQAGIAAARAGGRLGDIGYAINQEAVANRCCVIEECAGHGLGTSLHEEPVIPNTGMPGAGDRIVPGMVFTIEPVLSLGSCAISKVPDGWGMVTSDGSVTAQFEHTVAVFRDFTEVLTFPTATIGDHLDFPPSF
ncbi:MAG: type I methionyl aminopeptidase [Spirochaeta sp.]|nr:type I methionyl aminopeptidase [Spirochaeta sp.]